jgi:hypothetical protein
MSRIFNEHTLIIDESQRQMLLLALAHLAIERPGWDWTLGELAKKCDTVGRRPGRTLQGI